MGESRLIAGDHEDRERLDAHGWDGTWVGSFTEAEADGYARLLVALRGFLDGVASMRFDHSTVDALATDLERLREHLLHWSAPEGQRINGRVEALPVRGRALLPELHETNREKGRLEGVVTFGSWFLGAGAAVHGGAIALMLDDLLGRTAETISGTDLHRTAYLHVDYRRITPVNVELAACAWIDRVEGRKISVRAEVRHETTVCVEAEALLLRLRPDQGIGRSSST